MPKIIPIRDLRDTSKISNMVKEENEPIYVTKNGYSDMVIMSAEMYEDHLELLSIKQKLEVAERQIEKGEYFTAEESTARMKKVLEDSIKQSEE